MTNQKIQSIIALGIFFLFVIASCSDEQNEDNSPKYKTGTFVHAKSPGQTTFGDSVAITFYYSAEDSNYRFHDLKMEKLGSTDLYVEQLSFELELIKDYVSPSSETDSVVWKYLPEKAGHYGIIMDNPGEDDLRTFVRVLYESFEMTMDSTDYQIVLDSVRSNPNLEQYIGQFGYSEYYFGATAYYQNFDLRISPRIETGQTEFEDMTEEEAKEVMLDRIKTVLKLVLSKNYPEAKLNTVYYIYFETYNNDFSRSNYKAKYQYTGEGNQTEFKFIELNEVF